MDIALLNKRVTFQRQELVTDDIGNHTNRWIDDYSCMATISGEGGDEERDARQIVEKVDLSFTVRYCKEAAKIKSTEYRVIMDGDIYDITGIDHFSYTKKALKFKCRKAAR